MVVYSYNPTSGRFVGSENADPDPMVPGSWLIPANSTPDIPTNPVGTMWPYWNGEKWGLIDEGNTWKENQMREQRNIELQSSDWTQIPDVPMDGELRGRWAYYRQQLRDLTTTKGWPFVAMPLKPTQKDGDI